MLQMRETTDDLSDSLFGFEANLSRPLSKGMEGGAAWERVSNHVALKQPYVYLFYLFISGRVHYK